MKVSELIKWLSSLQQDWEVEIDDTARSVSKEISEIIVDVETTNKYIIG